MATHTLTPRAAKREGDRNPGHQARSSKKRRLTSGTTSTGLYGEEVKMANSIGSSRRSSIFDFTGLWKSLFTGEAASENTDPNRAEPLDTAGGGPLQQSPLKERNSQNETNGYQPSPGRDQQHQQDSYRKKPPMFSTQHSHNVTSGRKNRVSSLRIAHASAGPQSPVMSIDGTNPVDPTANLQRPSSYTGRDPQTQVQTILRPRPPFQTPKHESFQVYTKTVNMIYDLFGDAVTPLPRPPSQGSRGNTDILAAHRQTKLKHTLDQKINRVLSNAEAAGEHETLLRLKDLKLERQRKEEDISERIEDLTRRRRKWPTSHTPEAEAVIAETLRTRGIISSLPGAEVEYKDIVKLRAGEWLNDEIINFYGVMVRIRSEEAKKRRDKGCPQEGDEDLLDVWVFSSFFFAKLQEVGYAGVKRWSKKFDVFKKDIIILPVNLGNAHWVCAAINLKKKRFEYYDSMGRMNHAVTGKLREYLAAEHLEKKKSKLDLSDWQDYCNPKTPQQNNGYDCGIFTSQFIECLSREGGHFDFEQRNMPYLRKKMVHEIKEMQILPEAWH